MNIKRLVLFIYETLLLSDIEYLYSKEEYQIEYHFSEELLNPIFIEFLNHFIIDRYQENKELLKYIFDIPTLEEFVDKNYNILELNLLKKIFIKFRGKEKYLELVETTDKEIDNKLNILALNFIDYYNEAIMLSSAKPNIYQRVLQ